jgi:hypothetical protein
MSRYIAYSDIDAKMLQFDSANEFYRVVLVLNVLVLFCRPKGSAGSAGLTDDCSEGPNRVSQVSTFPGAAPPAGNFSPQTVKFGFALCLQDC